MGVDNSGANVKIRSKVVEKEAWTVAELNHAAAHDWKALPPTVAEAYERGGWVFGALVDGRRGIYIPTLEGPLFAAPDDYVIRGLAGEFYPCKPDVFESTYDREVE